MRGVLHVLFFAIVGPAIFSFIMNVLMFMKNGYPSPSDIEFWIVGAIFGYVLGLIPAILTGIFDYNRRHLHGLAATALVGGATSFITIIGWKEFVFPYSGNTSLSAYVVVTIAGVLSALICHALMKWLSLRGGRVIPGQREASSPESNNPSH